MKSTRATLVLARLLMLWLMVGFVVSSSFALVPFQSFDASTPVLDELGLGSFGAVTTSIIGSAQLVGPQSAIGLQDIASDSLGSNTAVKLIMFGFLLLLLIASFAMITRSSTDKQVVTLSVMFLMTAVLVVVLAPQVDAVCCNDNCVKGGVCVATGSAEVLYQGCRDADNNTYGPDAVLGDCLRCTCDGPYPAACRWTPDNSLVPVCHTCNVTNSTGGAIEWSSVTGAPNGSTSWCHIDGKQVQGISAFPPYGYNSSFGTGQRGNIAAESYICNRDDTCDNFTYGYCTQGSASGVQAINQHPLDCCKDTCFNCQDQACYSDGSVFRMYGKTVICLQGLIISADGTPAPQCPKTAKLCANGDPPNPTYCASNCDLCCPCNDQLSCPNDATRCGTCDNGNCISAGGECVKGAPFFPLNNSWAVEEGNGSGIPNLFQSYPDDYQNYIDVEAGESADSVVRCCGDETGEYTNNSYVTDELGEKICCRVEPDRIEDGLSVNPCVGKNEAGDTMCFRGLEVCDRDGVYANTDEDCDNQTGWADSYRNIRNLDKGWWNNWRHDTNTCDAKWVYGCVYEIAEVDGVNVTIGPVPYADITGYFGFRAVTVEANATGCFNFTYPPMSPTSNAADSQTYGDSSHGANFTYKFVASHPPEYSTHERFLHIDREGTPDFNSASPYENMSTGVYRLDFNITLEDCHSDCSDKFGFCNRDCNGTGGCNFPSQEVMDACDPVGAEHGFMPGDYVDLGVDAGVRKSVRCCTNPDSVDPTQPEESYAPPATFTIPPAITGGMDNLIRSSRLVNYNGRPVKMVIFTWEKEKPQAE